jgi:hypothetical protein
LFALVSSSSSSSSSMNRNELFSKHDYRVRLFNESEEKDSTESDSFSSEREKEN